MNFKISKNPFYDALQIVSHAISPNSPLPSLTGIKIDADENGLTLTASNADISIQKVLSNDQEKGLNLSVIESGSIVIAASYLLEIIRKIDADEVAIEIVDGSLTRISGLAVEYKINGIRTSDYPVIDFSKPETIFHIDADQLLKVINQTSFAASDKETRPVLTGVNFKAMGKSLQCIATDSYRLAKKTIPLETEQNFSVTIPAKSLNEVSRSIQKDEPVEIALNDKKAQFYIGSTMIQTRLLDGTYPETERLIPASFSYEMVCDGADLRNAIDRTLFMRTDGFAIIRLQCSKNEVILSNKSQEIGEFKQPIPVAKYEGADLDISFSGKYVYDAVRALDCNTVTVKFTGEMKPFVLCNPEDDSILQLVLPVRTYN